MATPVSTYRIQLTADFGFRDTAAIVPYLASLGVTHVYLSPVLESALGSRHGYDVVDHGRLSRERGGADGWRVLQGSLREHGLGCVVDIVPNHMAVPAPESTNPALWSVLRDGPSSPYARWFDVDWADDDGRLVLPVLGTGLDQAVANGELVRDGDLLRYHEHEYPIADGTGGLPWPDVVHAQHYALALWSDPVDRLNYRRFFDVSGLIGLRVEDAEVFEETHRLLLDLVAAGDIQGLRVDHPDGLADPRGYLRRLRAAAPDAWVVVEKILGVDEALPADWPCDGTSGYDVLRAVDDVFLDAPGLDALTRLHEDVTGEHRGWDAVAAEAKRDVLGEVLTAERARLAALVGPCLPAHDEDLLARALDELLVAMPVYRTYVVPGEQPSAVDTEVVERARQRAESADPVLAPVLRDLADLVLGRLSDVPAGEVVVRFQQLSSALTAKGVEDTAFYRWHVLVSRNEVGGDPGHPDVGSVARFHRFAQHLPAGTMTTLSTHDTKRSEDVRARLALLSEVPDVWARFLAGRHASGPADVLDGPTSALFWQTLAGTWPLTPERLTAYLRKACREAKRRTSWLAPDPGYEEAVLGYAEAVLADPATRAAVEAFVADLREPWACSMLAHKVLQLTMPGVPDCYQGAEALHLALVDPDNRRQVDYGRLGGLLAALDRGSAPPAWRDDPDVAKVHVVSRVLRLRRDRPDLFAGYAPLAVTGPAADHAIAFDRGGAIVVVPRLPVRLARSGGWRDTSVDLPEGTWTDAFTGRSHAGGTRLDTLFADLPVTLLHP
ncbi:MAG: malto-oligosyltrehalose synthase [Streptosporangiales bacterium]|nr:malto-oligosyltrehalose synthase [Streptosporangiales bacterium]